MIRSGAYTVFAAALFLTCSDANGQADGAAKVIDGYVDRLMTAEGANFIRQPTTFLLARGDWKVNEAPLLASSELVKMLAGCTVTNRAYSLARPNFPKWIQGHYSFECPSQKESDRAVTLHVATDLDGRGVENVVAVLGGEVSRMSPAPSQPRSN